MEIIIANALRMWPVPTYVCHCTKGYNFHIACSSLRIPTRVRYNLSRQLKQVKLPCPFGTQEQLRFKIGAQKTKPSPPPFRNASKTGGRKSAMSIRQYKKRSHCLPKRPINLCCHVASIGLRTKTQNLFGMAGRQKFESHYPADMTIRLSLSCRGAYRSPQ